LIPDESLLAEAVAWQGFRELIRCPRSKLFREEVQMLDGDADARKDAEGANRLKT
jgi:hypothetical protein